MRRDDVGGISGIVAPITIELSKRTGAAAVRRIGQCPTLVPDATDLLTHERGGNSTLRRFCDGPGGADGYDERD